MAFEKCLIGCHHGCVHRLCIIYTRIHHTDPQCSWLFIQLRNVTYAIMKKCSYVCHSCTLHCLLDEGRSDGTKYGCMCTANTTHACFWDRWLTPVLGCSHRPYFDDDGDFSLASVWLTIGFLLIHPIGHKFCGWFMRELRTPCLSCMCVIYLVAAACIDKLIRIFLHVTNGTNLTGLTSLRRDTAH